MRHRDALSGAAYERRCQIMVIMNRGAARLQLLCAAVLTGLALSTPAWSQTADAVISPEADVPQAVQAPGWDFSLRPYFFMSGLSGAVTAGPVTVPINSGFGDLIDNLRIGGFLAFTAEKGQWGMYADFQYISLKGSSTGPIDAELGLDNLVAEADVSFRPANAPTLKFLAGLRLYSVEQSLSIRGNPQPEASATVVDPILAAQGEWRLGERWDFELRGDIGGFGVGSEFTYQLLALAHWNISRSVNLPFGYRILSYQIRTGDIWMNTRMSGLVLGLDFRF
jgi:hypothetical protein